MAKEFLPKDYELPRKGGSYLNKLPQGKTKLRILTSPIMGWLDWDNNQPIRTPGKPETNFDPSRPARHFWAFVVWNYEEEKIQIMEVAQASIQNAIVELSHNEDWGNPKEYDISINRTGEQLETKYSVVPHPPKKLSKTIKDAFEETDIYLPALYSGDDPFAGKPEENETIDLDNLPPAFDK